MSALDTLFDLRFKLEAPNPSLEDVKNCLDTLTSQVKEGGPSVRAEIVGRDAYEIVCSAWAAFCDTKESNIRLLTPEAGIIREVSLRALWVLTPGFPEIMEDRGFTMLFQAFDVRIPEETHIVGLLLMRNVCIKSEKNREALAHDWKIVPPFVTMVKKEGPSAELVQAWCGALRTFVLNDDRREAYNRAPERKRLVFDQGGHQYLAQFLLNFTDEVTLNAIVNVLGIMASNEDFCIGIETGGGLRGLQQVLLNHSANTLLVKNTISAVRYMNISPIVREKSGGTSLMKLVVQACWLHRDDPGFVEIALSCMAFMTLRSPCGVAQLLVERGAGYILQIMKKDMGNVHVLKGACLTLRNVASSGGEIGRATIKEGEGESVLREVAATHETLTANYVNPTLRDLGLEQINTETAESQIIPEVQELEMAAAGGGGASKLNVNPANE